MIKVKVTILPILVVAVLTTLSYPAWGMPTLTIVGQGNDRYELMGQGLEGVGGISMTLEYDRTASTNPQVTLGGLFSGAIMAPNLNIPGTVKIGIVSPIRQGISGNGNIAMLTLSPINGISGSVLNFSAHMVSAIGGLNIPVQTFISVTATETAGSSGATLVAAASGSSISTTQNSSGSGSTTGLGNVVISSSAGTGQQPSLLPEATAKEMEHEPNIPYLPPEAPVVVIEESPIPSSIVTVKESAKPSVVMKSISEQFRDYGGERSPAAMEALFTSGETSGVRQEPAIALSDGTSTVQVTITVPAGPKSPSFMLSGAKLVSINNDDGFYILELCPEVGVNGVKITILNNGVVTGVPLIVAQPLDRKLLPGGILNESAVALYLKGAAGKRKDLNGDGAVTWLDDYIIMANYLAERNPEMISRAKSEPEIKNGKEKDGK